MTAAPPVRPAGAEDAASVRALLEASALPVADLDRAAIDLFVADHGGSLAGVVGIERFGAHGLLRSLAVTPGQRGSGLGTSLVEAAEAHARALGLADLVLLTTTAAPFFAKRGYAVIERHDAPAPVQHSAEFASICPASATCMLKTWSSIG